MNYTYKVFYEDDSLHSYGKIRSRLIRAKTPDKAAEKFERIFGIKPSYVE